jgi:hypothetical protein
VLNLTNARSFQQLNGPYQWAIDYAIYKRGEEEPYTTSSDDVMWMRSVPVEVELEQGEYVVQVHVSCLCLIVVATDAYRRFVWTG